MGSRTRHLRRGARPKATVPAMPFLKWPATPEPLPAFQLELIASEPSAWDVFHELIREAERESTLALLGQTLMVVEPRNLPAEQLEALAVRHPGLMAAACGSLEPSLAALARAAADREVELIRDRELAKLGGDHLGRRVR